MGGVWRALLSVALFLGAGTLIGCGPKLHPTAASEAEGTPHAAPVRADGAITIGYSDWPGWTCWDIAEQKGFFKKHNVKVKLVWYPSYTDSLTALADGAIDANSQTWSDTMGPLADGKPLKVVLVNDNSAGNDAIVAGPDIHSIKDLRGKKVATEFGTVEQFLLDKALAANGMSEKDIHYINIKIQDCPGAMIARKIDACALWEPNKTQLLENMPGTHVIFDSKAMPGLIADLLVFQSKTVASHPQDVQNIVDAWYDMMDYWRTHPDEAVAIMAQRTQQKTDYYKKFITGTRLFNATEAQSALTPSASPTSLYTSGKDSAQFLLDLKQISKLPDYGAALDATFVKSAVSRGEGRQTPYVYSLKVE